MIISSRDHHYPPPAILVTVIAGEAPSQAEASKFIPAEVRRSFNTTTVREQHPGSHHKGTTDANATGTSDRFFVFAN